MTYPGMPAPIIANDTDTSHLPEDFLEDQDEPIVVHDFEELEEIITNS